MEEKREREELVKKATFDELTGAYSKNNFDDVFKKATDDAVKYYGGNLGVTFVDLKKFKELNDKYGQTQGDEHLKKVADLLKNAISDFVGAIRSTDYLVRVGGDEFILLSPGLTNDKAGLLQGRIKTGVDKYNGSVTNIDLYVNLHIGTFCGNKEYMNLYEQANAEMRKNKRNP